MGLWSVPWQSVEKAKAFKVCMESPWIAEVKMDDEDYPVVELSEIGGMFWEQDVLLGSDHLIDLISDKAQQGESSFDIRELVKQSLALPMEDISNQPTLPKNLEALNIVRVALDLEELSKDRTLKKFQTQAISILKHIKSQDIGGFSFHLSVYTPEIKGISRSILGIPDGYDSTTVYSLAVETEDQKEHPIAFTDFPEVKKNNWDRPGLLKIYYITID